MSQISLPKDEKLEPIKKYVRFSFRYLKLDE